MRMRGETHYATNITDKLALKLLALYATGKWTYSKLCERFGLSKDQVAGIISGKTFRHLPRRYRHKTRTNLKNEKGKEYGQLKVLCRARNGNKGLAKWKCRCSCGRVIVTSGNSLRGGKTSCRSCVRAKRKYPRSIVSKELKSTYAAWGNMIQRCKNHPRYRNRGIKVCQRWKQSFANFLEDMGEKPSLELELERRNNDEGYSPENCKWATRKEQTRNTSRNHKITIQGVTKTITDWCLFYGTNYSTAIQRIKWGWDAKRAVKAKPKPHWRNNYAVEG